MGLTNTVGIWSERANILPTPSPILFEISDAGVYVEQTPTFVQGGGLRISHGCLFRANTLSSDGRAAISALLQQADLVFEFVNSIFDRLGRLANGL